MNLGPWLTPQNFWLWQPQAPVMASGGFFGSGLSEGPCVPRFLASTGTDQCQ